MMPKSSAMYLPWLAASTRDEDVARMHVGVEEAVAEHLREEDLDAGAREPLEVDARAASSSAMRPIGMPAIRSMTSTSLAVQSQWISGTSSSGEWQEVAAQLRAVGRLAREVELVVDGLLELGDDFARPQPLAVAPQPLDQRRRRVHQREVVLDDVGDVGPQHLDRDRRAVGQLGEVHLRDRRARDRRRVERAEHLGERPAVHAHERRHRPARTGTAARDPAAARARRRCRAAAGRGASTASGRT